MSGGEYQRAREDTAEKMRQKQKLGSYITPATFPNTLQWTNVFVFNGTSGRAQSGRISASQEKIELILDALLQCNARPE